MQPYESIKSWGVNHTKVLNLMAHQLHTNSLPTLQASSMDPASQITSTSLKLKTPVQSYIFQQVGRHVIRAIAYAKSLIDLLNTMVDDINKGYKVELERRKKRRRRGKEIFHVIKMCCIMSSSHVMPMSELESHGYYDSNWNSVILNDHQTEGNDDMDGYLQWLEEKEHGNDDEDDGTASENNIDRLAEKFIEKCHEKFRLEKQESYRRYQEMLARSL